MNFETVLAVVAFGIGVVATPIYIVLIVKAVRALTGIRNVLVTPLGDPGSQAQK